MVKLRDTQLKNKKHNYTLADGESIPVQISETGHFEVVDEKTAKAICDKYNVEGKPKRVLGESDEGFGLAPEKQSDKELTRVEVAGLKLQLEAKDAEIADLKKELADAPSFEDITKTVQDYETKLLKAAEEKSEMLGKLTSVVEEKAKADETIDGLKKTIAELEVKLAKAQELKVKNETPEIPKGKEEAVTGGQKEETKQKAK